VTLAMLGVFQEELRKAGAVLSPRWHVVAARLQEQMLGFPRRLRYDTVTLTRGPAEGGRQALDLRFEPVHFGNRRLDELHLLWWPGSHLEIVTPADKLPPLLDSWPMNDDGQLQERFLLPLSRGAAKQPWTALSAGDREMMLALMAVLPGAMRHARSSAPQGIDNKALVDASSKVLNEARRWAKTLHRKQLLRSLLGRRSAPA
jgi:hypothetical protein